MRLLKPKAVVTDSILIQENCRPVDDFQGLSASEMYRLIHEPLAPDTAVRLKLNIRDMYLDKIPFFRLVEDFLRLVEGKGGSIMLTKTGALQRAVCVELYGKGYIMQEGIEKGYAKLNREFDSEAISALRVVVVACGFVRKAKDRLHLTKKARKLMKDRRGLLEQLLHGYAERYNWGYLDYFPDAPVGQVAWVFNLFLLDQFGMNHRPAKEYAKMYRRAFSTLLDSFEANYNWTAEDQFDRCYTFRTMAQFLSWFGVVDYHERILEDPTPLIATSLLWDLFEFDQD